MRANWPRRSTTCATISASCSKTAGPSRNCRPRPEYSSTCCVRASAAKRPWERVVEDSVLSTLRYIGSLWETGRITVADEHAATEICRYVLYRLFDSIEPAKPVGLKALVSCVPGDEHELGVEIVGECLRVKGWEVFIVGRSTPLEDILKALADFRPHVAFFSATLVANLPAASALVKEAQQTLPGLGVVLGGAAAVAAADVLAGPAVAVAVHFTDAESLGVTLAGRNA
jgi:methanogenic corrinoid protein MtbC1